VQIEGLDDESLAGTGRPPGRDVRALARRAGATRSGWPRQRRPFPDGGTAHFAFAVAINALAVQAVYTANTSSARWRATA
jgi:hypothetical protein